MFTTNFCHVFSFLWPKAFTILSLFLCSLTSRHLRHNRWGRPFLSHTKSPMSSPDHLKSPWCPQSGQFQGSTQRDLWDQKHEFDHADVRQDLLNAFNSLPTNTGAQSVTSPFQAAQEMATIPMGSAQGAASGAAREGFSHTRFLVPKLC